MEEGRYHFFVADEHTAAILGDICFRQRCVDQCSKSLILRDGGAWLLFIMMMALSKIWQWNILLENYKSMDNSLKNGTFQKRYGIYLFRWARLFLGAEMKRFTLEGYPEDMRKAEVE